MLGEAGGALVTRTEGWLWITPTPTRAMRGENSTPFTPTAAQLRKRPQLPKHPLLPKSGKGGFGHLLSSGDQGCRSPNRTVPSRTPVWPENKEPRGPTGSQHSVWPQAQAPGAGGPGFKSTSAPWWPCGLLRGLQCPLRSGDSGQLLRGLPGGHEERTGIQAQPRAQLEPL